MEQGKRIAVVGSGAVGGYYGALLARREEENEVSFLMRKDLETVQRRGLAIRSSKGDFTIDPVRCFSDTAEIGPVDLVIVALKATANEALENLLRPLLHDETAIVTLQNGLGNEDFLVRHFPGRPVLGGLCFVCLNRVEPGVVRHIAHGRIEMGDHTGCGTAMRVAHRFARAGIDCEILDDLRLARWRKLVWNVPFNGLAIAGGGIDVSRILDDPALLDRTRKLMGEVVEAAAAQGLAIDPDFPETNIAWTRKMGPYRPSSLLDFLAGREVEVEAIWGEPLRRARAVGVETPELEALYAEIGEKIEAVRGEDAADEARV